MTDISHCIIDTGRLRLHVAEQGHGPLVLLVHGFPESWYSWRHQLPALAAAGYRAVAFDHRGYGDSDRPDAIEAYDQVELAADVAALIDALGEQQAVVVGHDWGAMVAWHSALLHADKVRAVVGMSVPFGGRTPHPPLARMQAIFKNMFFYMLYFQEPGVAEAELQADIRTSLRKFYLSASGEVPLGAMIKLAPKDSTLLSTLFDDGRMPGFLSDADLDYYTERFTLSGFRGPLNFYRNFDRTWERTAELADARIMQPAMFIAGERDPVILFSQKQLQRMPELIPNLRQDVRLAGAGHWVQQEKPAEVSALLLDFLYGLDT